MPVLRTAPLAAGAFTTGLSATVDAKGRLEGQAAAGAVIEVNNLTSLPTGAGVVEDGVEVARAGADGRFYAQLKANAGDVVQVQVRVPGQPITTALQLRVDAARTQFDPTAPMVRTDRLRVALDNGVVLISSRTRQPITEPDAIVRFKNVRTGDAVEVVADVFGRLADVKLAGIAGDRVEVLASDGSVADLVRAKPVEVRAATRWDIPIPDFKENPNEKRVARLGEIARDVAERVAVVGDRVVGTLLQRIALRPESELLDALDELTKRSILVEEDDGVAYRFADADDRKALLAALKPERQQQLHLLAARAAIDQAHRTRRPVNPEELASHYLAAKENVLAIEQLTAAAKAALAASATQTAAQRVREAQELLAAEQKAAEERGDAREPRLVRVDVELVLLRLDVLAAVNEHRECVTLAQRRLPRMQGSVDGALVAEVLLRLAASERMLGDLDAALDHTGQVLSRTERGGSHALRCRAKALCGLIYEQRGSFDLAERYFHDALELAHTIGDELEEERARWAIASRRLSTGALDEAQREFTQLLQLATARGEKLRITQYVNALGIVAHERNQLDDAEVAYRRMIELAKPTGDRRSLANALNNIAVIRRDVGDFDDALVLTGKAARILNDLDQVENLAYLRIVESQILLDRAAVTGKAADNIDALKKAEEGLDIALKANAALKVAEAALCRGLAMCRKGDLVGRDEIERAIRTARQVNANRIVLFGALCDVETLTLINDRPAARTALVDAVDRAKRTGFKRFELKLVALGERLAL